MRIYVSIPQLKSYLLANKFLLPTSTFQQSRYTISIINTDLLNEILYISLNHRTMMYLFIYTHQSFPDKPSIISTINYQYPVTYDSNLLPNFIIVRSETQGTFQVS